MKCQKKRTCALREVVDIPQVPDSSISSFQSGKKVLLATAHRRRDYIQGKDGRVAKFMTRYDGPYMILKAFWLH